MKHLIKFIGLYGTTMLLWFCSAAQPNVTRVEYYIDSDPGYGAATNVTISAGTNLANQTINIDPSSLSPGIHFLGLRAKDANGNWSLNQKWIFVKPSSVTQTAPPAKTIKQVEYYIDNDPGWGNGVPVAIQNNATHLSDILIAANVTGLTTGLHNFYIRGKDTTDAWSLTDTLQFNIPTALSTPAITVNSIVAKTSNCARDSFDISYDKTGTYNAGNKFNVELSDASGSFTSPTIIGSYTGTGNAIIKARLPSHLTDGTNYQVRVSSTNPVVTGVANATTLTIHDRPTVQSITGAGDANATFSYPYSIPSFTGSTWTWLAPAASITQTNNTANLLWKTAAQPDTIKIIETNQYGCVGDTSIKYVNVYNLKVDNVAVSSLTPCPSENITVTGNATGVFDVANKFTAQLSDASGSFASPVNIGSQTANPVGLSQAVSINATLPFPLANGAGYRIRIVANSPAVTGIDNGQNITINKPNLGADQTVSKCPGSMADISSVFNATGLTVLWNTADPTSVDVGTYQLIVTNANGCKDTANVTVTNYPKPNLGADKSTTISCANGTADLTTLYNTSGYSSVVYSVATPAAAGVGVYTLIVTTSNGCKDTTNITVLDASTVTVPTAGSDLITANRECTDAQGWTHYYDDNGTPTDYSDDIRLLSIKKNGNNIGTVGDGTFQLKVAATSGAGSNHAVFVSNNLVTTGNDFYSMNRYWNITPTNQPTSSVGVRFYYNTQDLTDVNGDITGGPINHTQLTVYKLQGGNPDPTSNWAGATGVNYYTSGVTASLSNWVYTDLGNNRHQAEFLVSSFSGGGAGVIALSPLPVTYVSFTANAEKDKVVLQWSTATEINSKDFEVQRSLDGIHFETIATVNAAGNSNSTRNYSFDDLQSITLKGKVVFFRIVETDIDGHLFYTDVKKVKISDSKNKFTLAYNPVRNEAVLNYECVEKDEVLIRVIDHLGQVVINKEVKVMAGTNKIQLQTGNLAKGIYEVELTSNKNQGVVRMMKE
ncbi:hypothetical protein FW778_16305 [Ginsengibacter hankyongi]|uniref:Secretion system C-terminal sorting domain-containing protein n=1 Tax=Ginsengibacter hankyongi TaxID=2607284 RepID=A0A5J5IF94_9BACT|nr:T9SS type A sorting domain-containing protein [Ginsengibacter hankyongi]KAA9037655.1 hypothetical protein FW778_16305 [Ginsengibacter hankyongi]